MSKNITLNKCFAADMLFTLLGELTTNEFFKEFLLKTAKNADLTLTNIPGCTTKLLFNGEVLDDIIPYVTVTNARSLSVALTYGNYLRMSVCVDKQLKFTAEDLVKYMEDEFDIVCKGN